MKNVEVAKFKDIVDPYFINQTKEFIFFEVCVFSRFNVDHYEDPCNRKIGVAINVTYDIKSENYSTYTRESASDFLHMVIAIYLSDLCSPQLIPEKR